MWILLLCVLVSLLVGAGLFVIMFRHRDGYVGLLGLVAMHVAGVLGVVFAAAGGEL